MKDTIIFSEETSMCFEPGDDRYNHTFIKHSVNQFWAILQHRGYLYLHEIYEHLGVKFDLIVSPAKRSRCYFVDDPIVFSYEIPGINGKILFKVLTGKDALNYRKGNEVDEI